MSEPSKKTDAARWRAVVWYRTEGGPVDVEHWLEELYELDDLVEAGPHWDTIEKIDVTRVNHTSDGADLTVERAAEL
jgi:hypothetical protein